MVIFHTYVSLPEGTLCRCCAVETVHQEQKYKPPRTVDTPNLVWFVHWVQSCSTCLQSDTALCFQSSSSTQVETPKSSTKKTQQIPPDANRSLMKTKNFLIGDLSIGEEEENALHPSHQPWYTWPANQPSNRSCHSCHLGPMDDGNWVESGNSWYSWVLAFGILWLNTFRSSLSFYRPASTYFKTKVIRATKKIYGSSWWLGFHQGADDNHHGLIQTLDLLKGVPKNKKSSL